MDTRHTTREYIQTIKDAINVGSVCSRMKLRKGMLNASDFRWMGIGQPQHNSVRRNNINTMLMPPRDIDRIAVESYMILQQLRIYGGPLGHTPFDKKYFFHHKKK